ncbi:hypothetical protein QVD17_38876 [Tagetes erecta]|uniref:Uncharacterized protein n=1 Tax=Tagetes erecta TaxID=13708 RepID=A0AAD8JRB7_TARER|nr:hypothetical protein QVD17_38876 [Tagetes erecta]
MGGGWWWLENFVSGGGGGGGGDDFAKMIPVNKKKKKKKKKGLSAAPGSFLVQQTHFWPHGRKKYSSVNTYTLSIAFSTAYGYGDGGDGGDGYGGGGDPSFIQKDHDIAMQDLPPEDEFIDALADHQYLLFPEDEVAQEKCNKLKKMTVGGHIAIDWTFLDEIAETNRAREIIGIDTPWARLFEAAANVSYRELTVEFLSSFDTCHIGIAHLFLSGAVSRI